MVGHSSTLQSRVKVTVGYGVSRSVSSREVRLHVQDELLPCDPNAVCPVKCRGDGEKEVRRNIRYPVGRIYIIIIM